MSVNRWGDCIIPSKWKGVRFFAQLAEELLFYFSHDSFKVPTLNFHYLCIEMISIIYMIEDGALEKGNIIPVLKELLCSFKQDVIIKNFYGEDINIIFKMKDNDGEYKQTFEEIMKNPTSDLSIQRVKKCLLFLRDDLGRKSRYYYNGISEIKKLIQKEELNYLELDQLMQYTRIILTELINAGYSQEYIYASVLDTFFRKGSSASEPTALFEQFTDCFPLKNREYIIYLPLSSRKIKDDLRYFEAFNISDNIFEMFENTCQYIIKLREKAMDPEKAKNQSIALIEFCRSVSQYCQHSNSTCFFKYAEVVDAESHQVYKLKTPSQPISRGIRSSVDAENLLRTCLRLESGAFTAIGLHASAFQSKDYKNQLLNLWTAMEVLIPVERNGNQSRINQIANSVSTILSSSYIRTLLAQLDKQLAEALGMQYESVLQRVDICNKRTNKLLATLVLPDYTAAYEDFIGLLDFAPLISYRMQQYKSIFSSGAKTREFYIRHSKRVSWQIMRIYRNRNMIIHNGDTMPFLEVILQNLHFYIDSVIDTFCRVSSEGYGNAASIISKLALDERIYISNLADDTVYSKDNFIYAILQESE